MEKQRSRQKRKKDRVRYALDREIPDAPTLEEFECLLGESPSNYPKGEGVENMENELYSAATDTEAYEKANTGIIDENSDKEQTSQQDTQSVNVVDTVVTVEDDTEAVPSAPEVDKLETSVEATIASLSAMDLESAPTAPVLDDIPCTIPIPAKLPQHLQKPMESIQSDRSPEKAMISSISHKTIKPFTEAQLASLYSNQELSLAESFVNEFIEFQLRTHGQRQQHKLHDLLMNYLRVRNHLVINSQELESLKKACKETQKKLWCLDKASVTESGECQDGNPVSATHEYSVAHFNQEAVSVLTRNLSAVKESLHNIQSLYCYEAETLKLKIEHYVQRVCGSCKKLANLAANAPVDLVSSQSATSIAPQIVELRMCITILFSFQRKILRDTEFVNDTREWLTKMVSILLRIATWQDHLFILNHILRCPGGVTEWACNFVQIPLPPKINTHVLSTSPFNNPYLDHIVACLAVILMPIKERDKFLEQVHISLQPNSTNDSDTVWVMLDEDGEEDEDVSNRSANLTELDLISLLNQIPLNKLFEQAMHIKIDADEQYRQNKIGITEHHILKVFAFSTLIVRTLRKGMKTYDSPRYRQLAKRLSSLIRDVVQNASDLWESFDKTQVSDGSMLIRLQTEYDCFFLRAVICVFSSRRLGAWQYLAALPYRLVSTTTLWQIFYILHTDSVPNDMLNPDAIAEWEMDLSSENMRKHFEEKLSNLPGDESYFLLTTFANMAMARNNQDYEFVRTATIDLFQIGFLSSKTQDSCSKDARSLLSNLTSKYPSLLSDIIFKLKDNFLSVGKLSIYLFTELSIHQWIPKNEDFRILSNWLHNLPLNHTESYLARLIISHLNWGLDNYDNLFLPLEFHRLVALLIVELTLKYVPENTPAQAVYILSEGVKQVSSIVRSQNNEQSFATWAWNTLAQLRIHQLEQSDAACQYAISNPSQAFLCVPDLELESSLEVLAAGIKEKQPIACYVAIRMTQIGHSVPLICSKGFNLLQILQSYYKYEQVLLTLNDIIPLFLESPEVLYNNEKFMSIIRGLVQADRTYVKMAKNLISSNFPGPILRMFSNMIEFQLQNARRYCLASIDPLVKLWLNILVLLSDWNRDQSTMYLIDTLLRASFFHLGAKAIAENIFQNLLSNTVTTRSSGSSLGSLFSWATGNNQSLSLLSNASLQSIWLAYQILHLEQHERETKTGLWRELMRELSVQNKTSLDSALKRACATVKVQFFNSNNLAIYRWSQQALDTPMGHPLLPILWQKFFTLFLARVPTTTGTVDKGGIGEKFFEGMINLSFLKKLKKRLLDTTEHFQLKCENEMDEGKPISDERRIFYLSTAKYYKTLSLWLEEPRLHEPGLYLPALPPQYMSHKLILLLQNNEEPWLEYIDYHSVRLSQEESINNWNLCCRQSQINSSSKKAPVQTPTTPIEPPDPVQRIYRRLNSYEQPVPPPPLTRNEAKLPHVPVEKLYESATLVNVVKPHLKVIFDYAQSCNMLVSEHTAIDCSFLELIPTLYKDVENQLTLHALCDPAPNGNRKLRSGTPPVVHCAGAAVIYIKVLEARLNDAVDHMIIQNRAEYDNLLIKASHPPPTKVTLGCVFVDHLIGLLEHELHLNKTTENTSVLRNVQESGTKLFYHIIQLYKEEASLCPATKQLITTCVEKLGQLFISGEESQAPRLLHTIIERPTLGGLLGPHFTPVAGGASTFLQMYQTVVELSNSSNADLCFVLLTKFDVANWLNYRRPRLSERSTFIDLVMKALCNAGLHPEDNRLILHELFRNHLRSVLLHEFPEHYGEVLTAILRGSESQSLAMDVWRDFLGALSSRPKNSQMPLQGTKVKEEIKKYATEQRLLSRQEIHDTAVLLSKHFMNERLQYGLYGLYPKYRIYNEPLTTFLGMIGHALVVQTLQSDRGTLADQLCERLWPVLSEMFAPWLTPYWTRNLREPTAAWIQQLTDDRSVLLPWIITDGPFANRTMSMFIECIRFIMDTMPASNRVLSYLWQFYVQNYAHPTIKDHVLNVVHGNLLSLSWDKFNPTMADIELMVKVVDQYLPDSHLLLGSVFFSINWQQWISEHSDNQQLLVASRIHVCLLNLLVKLSNEPNVRQNEKAIKMMHDADGFSWHLVDSAAFDQVVNWHVMSCDPRVVLIDNEEVHSIDVSVHKLLKIAAAYDSTVVTFHPTTLKKRQIFVRSSVKLLINCTTRHKNMVTSNSKVFSNALSRLLDEMEMILMSTVSESQQVAEASLLVTELLHCVNQSSVLTEFLRTSLAGWLLRRSSSSPVLLGILKVMSVAVIAPAALGEIMEAALEAYFKQNVVEEIRPTWAAVLNILQPVVPRQPPIETVLVSAGRVLSLHAILLKRLPSCSDIKEEGMLLSNLIEWISSIKPNEANEEKLPLLWAKALELIHRQCQYSDSTVVAARALRSLARALLLVAEDSGQGWGILGAIGLRKGTQLSNKCKFLSRALAVYCLAQLPESSPLTSSPSAQDELQSGTHQLVRFTSQAPGVAPSRSDLESQASAEVRPSTEAIKAMQGLEALLVNKQYFDLKSEIEQSIRIIRDPANSVHNAVEVCGTLCAELYTNRYLHPIIE